MTYTIAVEDTKDTRKSYPLRMPDELRAQLEALATAEDRSLHSLILSCLRSCARAAPAQRLPGGGDLLAERRSGYDPHGS